MSHSYDVGTRAWQPDATEGWVASEVVKKTVDGDKVTLVFKLENEEVREYTHGVYIPPSTADHVLSAIDQNYRDLSRGLAKLQRLVSPASDESRYARG